MWLPRFEFGIVVCALRDWQVLHRSNGVHSEGLLQAGFSPYFCQLCKVHCVEEPTEALIAQASAAVVPPAIAAREVKSTDQSTD